MINEQIEVKDSNPPTSKVFPLMMGLIAGGLMEGCLGSESNIENVVETALATGAIVPLLNRYVSKQDWSAAYKNSPYHAIGYLAGQTIIKYLK